jgi:hypothetical protein
VSGFSRTLECDLTRPKEDRVQENKKAVQNIAMSRDIGTITIAGARSAR